MGLHKQGGQLPGREQLVAGTGPAQGLQCSCLRLVLSVFMASCACNAPHIRNQKLIPAVKQQWSCSKGAWGL